MRVFFLARTRLWTCRQTICPRLQIPRRGYASADAEPVVTDIRRVRNIGIIAHIDAGKTTTTERMLFYSGYTKRIGNVDEGDTVMDYLPAERNRGITITSAAISFDWNNHRINLIDTPGHADFTFEVIRSIRVLDGAVTVLDAVAGVEAQTEKVWRQAQEIGIPRIIFVNKMDREGAGFGRTVREVVGKLSIRTCIINLPYFKKVVGHDGMTNLEFCGVIDVLDMVVIEWVPGTDGRQFIVQQLTESDFEEAKKARMALIETLAELDEEMVEHFLLAEDDLMAISTKDIKKSLRKCTLDGAVAPVLCGASFRNIGVQPLLDAVVDYLPSPNERPPAILRSTGKPLPVAQAKTGFALAFKVIHDNHSGKILVFVRVYSGTLKKHSKIFNTTNGKEERASRLSRMYANESIEVEAISEGHIGVISGTTGVRTGDTIAFNYRGSGPKSNGILAMQLNPITVPSPVFFAAVEPKTISDSRPLTEGLQTLLREDPSLQVRIDEETGQIQLSGMGELHLEISRDRLINDLKVNAHVGTMQISYKESLDTGFGRSESGSYEYTRTNSKGLAATAKVTLTIQPIPEDLEFEDDLRAELQGCISLSDNNYLKFQDAAIVAEEINPSLKLDDVKTAVQNGVLAGLFHGKRYNLPMHSILVAIEKVELPLDQETLAPVTPATRFALSALLEKTSTEAKVLMEPVMDVTVIVDEEDIGQVMSDLSSARSARVYGLEDDGKKDNTAEVLNPNEIYSPPDRTLYLSKHNIRRDLSKHLIKAKVPLGEMVGYLKYLRSMTQGRGSFLMTFDRYERVSKERASAIWEKRYG